LPGLDQQACAFADDGAVYREAFGESARPTWILGKPVQQFATARISKRSQGLIESRHTSKHVT